MDNIDKDMILLTKKISQLEDLFSISSSLVEQKLQDVKEMMRILLDCKDSFESVNDSCLKLEHETFINQEPGQNKVEFEKKEICRQTSTVKP